MSKADRIVEAYKMMAELGYRPAAPSDGLGNVTIPSSELEAGIEGKEYARRFIAEEDTGEYFAGNTDYTSLRAAVLTLEAFRLMNAGMFWDLDDEGGPELVPALLRAAAEEYERSLEEDQ